jgi:hypothetical protein
MQAIRRARCQAILRFDLAVADCTIHLDPTGGAACVAWLVLEPAT